MIASADRDALVSLLADRVEFGVPLARHTSLRIGGPADALATPADRDELARLLALCHARGLPTRVLGAGFNVLVREGGLRGVVLRLKKLRGIERTEPDAIHVEAGASHSTITRFCVTHGLAGLEFGAGIPGTLGGWLAMNAGIGSRELKDVVREIELLDRTGRTLPPRGRAEPRLPLPRARRPAGGRRARRGHTRGHASEREAVQAEIDRLLARRQATQPTDVPSCGSVFRNPPGDFLRGGRSRRRGSRAREGAAEISTVHANFIVNHGGATARDVLRLIERARETVARATGIEPRARRCG
ncbi:MAG: FAD-binding protein [Myxococcota bacterium]